MRGQNLKDLVYVALGVIGVGLAAGYAGVDMPQSEPDASAPSLTGRASVIDGDTIEIHGHRIRLEGIDAPESRQTCRRGSLVRWQCGQAAAMALSDFIGPRTVACNGHGRDRYGRTLARCSVGGVDMQAWMVGNGYALAYRRYSTDYVAQESQAQAAAAGLWAGEFIPPWEWRKLN